MCNNMCTQLQPGQRPRLMMLELMVGDIASLTSAGVLRPHTGSSAGRVFVFIE